MVHGLDEGHIASERDGFKVQDCGNSSVVAMELQLPCRAAPSQSCQQQKQILNI